MVRLLQGGLARGGVRRLLTVTVAQRRRGDRIECDVGFWHLADILLALSNVRFWGKRNIAEDRECQVFPRKSRNNAAMKLLKW